MHNIRKAPSRETMNNHEPPIEDRLRIAVRQVRKIIVLVIGGTVVLAGLVMMVLPGPAIVVVPAGLAILATEFVWARRLLRRARDQFRSAKGPAAGESAARDREADPPTGGHR